MITLERHLRGAASTERLGAEIALLVKPPLILKLEGDLGAGKTTFVRGFVRALPGGRDVTVQSPTFALARTYPTTPPVHHLDLYRLRHPSELSELGLLELIEDSQAFSLVEWPALLEPQGLLVGTLTLEGENASRRARVTLPTPSANT